MKNYQIILLSLFSVCLFYLLGSAFLSGLDKQIASECAIYPSRDYCVMFSEAQEQERAENNVLFVKN